MPHNVGSSTGMNRQAFLAALHFTGDRLECIDFKDGWSRIDEYRKGKRIFRHTLFTEAAKVVADDFEDRFPGKVEWK